MYHISENAVRPWLVLKENNSVFAACYSNIDAELIVKALNKLEASEELQQIKETIEANAKR